MLINCVIVTYNRLSLLKECIDSVLRQNYTINKIFIVNNNSNDGTKEYIDSINNNKIIAIHLDNNIGGAGGFSEGMKQAVNDGCDWVWMMDDDTIANYDSLEKLVNPINHIDNVGFVCSKVIWKDGNVHRMNIPSFDLNNEKPLNYYSQYSNSLLVDTASFVSIIISSKVIKKIGLPLDEFFIWNDDSEFTSRIYNNNNICLYAGDSLVTHKTPANYFSDLRDAPIETAWKFEYGIRNEVFLRKKRKNKFTFYISYFLAYKRAMRKISKRPKEEKIIFSKYIKKGYWNGLFFNPQIKYIK